MSSIWMYYLSNFRWGVLMMVNILVYCVSRVRRDWFVFVQIWNQGFWWRWVFLEPWLHAPQFVLTPELRKTMVYKREGACGWGEILKIRGDREKKEKEKELDRAKDNEKNDNETISVLLQYCVRNHKRMGKCGCKEL